MILTGNFAGQIAGILTAICWTVTALSFEFASKRVGSMQVNIIRLFMAFVFFMLLGLLRYRMVLPLHANFSTWTWLSVSGLIGFVIGDLLLFRAFVLIGSRISMLIYASVPPITAIVGWLVLEEQLTSMHWLGMALTICGIAVVVLQRNGDSKNQPSDRKTVPKKLFIEGVLFAFGGSVGQAAGLVLSKLGAPEFDAFFATQIRTLAGLIGFAILFLATKRIKHVTMAMKDKKAMIFTGVGAFFGPFVGVSLGLLSAQLTSTGVASTLMATVPVLIIVPSIIIFKEKVTVSEILGAILAVAGIACMFL